MAGPSIIDSHAHLDDIYDLEPALKRAGEAGVSAIIAVGVNLDSDRKILDIYSRFNKPGQFPAIYPALGFHPGDVDTYKSDSVFKLIEDNAERIVAVGEIGLDYWYKEARYEGPVRRLQGEIFLRQLDIAKRHGKPVIIHSRGAWKECLNEAIRHRIKRAVFHWYSGPEDILQGIIENGYFISAAPSSEYSREHRTAIELAPLERIFLETDSPVTFKPESGKYRSEPRHVFRSLRAVSEIKNADEAQVARKTTENAVSFFNLRNGAC